MIQNFDKHSGSVRSFLSSVFLRWTHPDQKPPFCNLTRSDTEFRPSIRRPWVSLVSSQDFFRRSRKTPTLGFSPNSSTGVITNSTVLTKEFLDPTNVYFTFFTGLDHSCICVFHLVVNGFRSPPLPFTVIYLCLKERSHYLYKILI